MMMDLILTNSLKVIFLALLAIAGCNVAQGQSGVRELEGGQPLTPPDCPVEGPKGIYVIAHRCNTKKWFDYALEWEANGIEMDITKDNGKLYAWHGGLGNPGDFLDFLVHIRERLLNDPNGKKVSLLHFDIKYGIRDKFTTADIDSLRELVKKEILDPVNEGKANNEGLFVFYGTSEGEDADMMAESIDNMPLSPWEGVNYDAKLKTDPETANEWRIEHNVNNFLYSSGIIILLSPNKMWDQLEKACNIPTMQSYAWTFGNAENAARALEDYGLVGLIGNMPQNFGWLPTNLEYYGLEGYYLVTREDSPTFL